MDFMLACPINVSSTIIVCSARGSTSCAPTTPLSIKRHSFAISCPRWIVQIRPSTSTEMKRCTKRPRRRHYRRPLRPHRQLLLHHLRNNSSFTSHNNSNNSRSTRSISSNHNSSSKCRMKDEGPCHPDSLRAGNAGPHTEDVGPCMSIIM
uniref:Uncharacterized protein n=1 Tax=Sipha flava TaxID=143950 RepID=A0A2S2QZG5_9HEMI